jgi:putative secretion ATPase (PEP-CTERM system associated)
MYNHYYGFQEKPFSLTPDPHFLYLSTVHKRALAYLVYGLQDKKGFITITGEIGAGKTTIIQALIKQLDVNTTVARIINTNVSALQLLKMIIRDFGLEIDSESKENLLEKLNLFLLEQYSQGHNSVIIIDEAQNLDPSSLEEIRLLSNLETDKDKLLQIILVGQPELRITLSLPELRQLRQRITVSYHISPLTHDEVGEYIKHRLAVAGVKNREIFIPAAVEEIYQASGGIPRLINIVCDAALVTGYVKECEQITDTLINGVLNELKIDAVHGYPEPVSQKSAVAPAANIVRTQLAGKLAHESQHGAGGLDQSQAEREKYLLAKQNELNTRQEKLCEKLEQLLNLERELIAREQKIRKREMDLEVSKNTTTV